MLSPLLQKPKKKLAAEAAPTTAKSPMPGQSRQPSSFNRCPGLIA